MREPCYEEGRIGKIVLLVIVCSALDYFNDFIVPNFFHITPR